MPTPAMPAPGTMGVTLENGVGTIRVYSETATSIELCLLNTDDPRTVDTAVALSPGADFIWSASHPDLKVGAKYALRVDGPEGPRNRFNNSLFLIDPFARGVVRESAREYH